MRWSCWLSACFVSTCARQVPSPGVYCPTSGDGRACAAVPSVRACVVAAENNLPTSEALCEHAWRETGSETAMVAGARYALDEDRYETLRRWAVRAQPTIEGARVLHFWGEAERFHGDLRGAEDTFRRVLGLRLDRDPARAVNTALALLDLVQSTQPAEESIELARLAWEQAELNKHGLQRAYAANQLVELLVDLGELSTAAVVIERMDASQPQSFRALRDGAKGRLEAARGKTLTSIELLKRASRPRPDDPGGRFPLKDTIELTQALVDDGQVGAARRELDRALGLVSQNRIGSRDVDCRLAAATASVELAEGDIEAALATVDRGLAIPSRDSARVRLLNIRGDALAHAGQPIAAERAWQEAADWVERWRESIPTTQLRSGLVARQRHALEAWLESTGTRGDAEGALQVTQRILGRELLDRSYQREVNAPATADASIRDVQNRLVVRRELSVTMMGTRARKDLRALRHDVVAIMSGARSVWAIRRAHGRWSIKPVGDRETVRSKVDAYRGNIDDPGVAAELGDALFPVDTLPEGGTPLVVMLDRELSDVALAGLRVGGKYLVEHAAILEVLAPDLAFAPVPDRAWGPSVVLGDPRGDLPGSVAEAQAVASEFGVRAVLEHDAARAVLENSGRARVLHVGAHSEIKDGRAAFVLSDGVFSTSDIVRRKIAPRLAVIATCRSQVDDDPAASLVAAFLAAGSPGVIGVKRALDDVDGTPLMLDFYRFYHRHGELDPVRALALAQRLAISLHRSPRAWATVSFFGVGGWIQ